MTWICRDKKIEYKKPLIMGIVNITPDSFSDGGEFFKRDDAVSHALKLISDGADIIDLGAQSTRPGYVEVSADEEIRRLSPVLAKIRSLTDKPISVDTYFPKTAKAALELGADIINDVSGNVSDKMAEIVKESGAGWIIMHSGAGSVNDVKSFFIHSIKKCTDFGIKEEQICFDMGMGFGKSYEENLELLANVKDYKIQGFPLLLGVSRKRVIGKASGEEDVKNRIFGNIAADTAALLGGCDIFRVHDVKNEKKGINTAYEIYLKKR